MLTHRCVCAPQYLSAGTCLLTIISTGLEALYSLRTSTSMSPKASVSILVAIFENNESPSYALTSIMMREQPNHYDERIRPSTLGVELHKMRASSVKGSRRHGRGDFRVNNLDNQGFCRYSAIASNVKSMESLCQCVLGTVRSTHTKVGVESPMILITLKRESLTILTIPFLFHACACACT